MLRFAAGLMCLLLVAACQQTGSTSSPPSASETATTDTAAQSAADQQVEDNASQPVSETASESGDTLPQIAEAEAVEEVTVPEVQQASADVDHLVYEESFTFDWDMSQRLRRAEGEEVVLLTPEGVTLTEIPEQLDRWLSRVKENGGFVKATASPKEGEEKSRFLVGAMIDVLLYLLGIVKEEVTFSPADDYDAILFYEEETGEVERIVFYPKR